VRDIDQRAATVGPATLSELLKLMTAAAEQREQRLAGLRDHLLDCPDCNVPNVCAIALPLALEVALDAAFPDGRRPS
jgi:hypothetical protein